MAFPLSKCKYIGGGKNRKITSDSGLYELYSSTTIPSILTHMLPNNLSIRTPVFFLKIVREDLSPKNFENACNELANESKILERCSHPHIIQVFELGVLGDGPPRPFSVQECFNGGTLADLLTSPSDSKNNSIFHPHTLPISYDMALYISRSLSLTLQYLHDNLSPEFAVVHRNLRPESIGFSGDGLLKLFDFTMAAQLNKSSGSDIETSEMLFGKLITCRKPFQGYTSAQLKSEVLSGGSRPDLSDGQFALSERLQELVSSCWASNPSDRPSFRFISEQLEILNNVHKKTKLSPRNKGRPSCSSGEPCKSSREFLLSCTTDDAGH
eukprot:gene25214-32901_t